MNRMIRRVAAALLCGPAFLTGAAIAADVVDISSLFTAAQQEGRVGLARKSKPIDARPATPGEIVVSVIAGENEETRSKPAEAGDMVVRNRCEVTGHEQYLVKAGSFAQRYERPLGAAGAEGWTPYRPRGIDMLYLILREVDGSFSFTAPWGEPMIAAPGDAIVRNPRDPNDTYRVARDAFSCTYEIISAPQAAKAPF
jgi:hypothetical protein